MFLTRIRLHASHLHSSDKTNIEAVLSKRKTQTEQHSLLTCVLIRNSYKETRKQIPAIPCQKQKCIK